MTLSSQLAEVVIKASCFTTPNGRLPTVRKAPNPRRSSRLIVMINHVVRSDDHCTNTDVWRRPPPASEPEKPCGSVCPTSWRTTRSPRCWKTTPPPSDGWPSWWRTCRRARSPTPGASRSLLSDVDLKCAPHTHAHTHPHPHPHAYTHTHTHTHVCMRHARLLCLKLRLVSGGNVSTETLTEESGVESSEGTSD